MYFKNNLRKLIELTLLHIVYILINYLLILKPKIMPIDFLNAIKGFAEQAIAGNADVPADKQGLAIETVTGAIASGIKNVGASGIAGLLSGGGNQLLQGIESAAINALMSKVGLNQGVAGGIISKILPLVTGFLTSKSGQGLDLGSIIGGLGNLGGGGDHGLLSTIKGLFGK